jgi:serine/threonine-protein kinase
MDAGSLGRYRLIDLLGAGGMGQVYRAFDSVTNRTVALKVLPPHLAGDTGFQQRFVREANTIAALTEPHIVPIHGFGEIDGHLYVDMRLIEGRDLHAVLEEGPLSPLRAVAIIEQIAAALDAAHQAGLVHRDVKPSNILITNSEFAYLIDFGIAWAADSPSLTGTGNMIGTWQYMAPERFGSGPIDGRSDTYSLACVLYECLTGARPFPGTAVEQQIAGHLSTPPPRPSTAARDVPTAFDEVIARGMAKDPNDRYPTVLEFARAARIACEGNSVPSAPERVPPTVQAPVLPPAMDHPSTPAPQPIAHAPMNHPRTQVRPPPWQSPPSTSPKRSRRRPIIAASVGVVVVIAVVIAIVLNVNDSGTSSTPGTKDVRTAFAATEVVSKASQLAAAATSAHYDLTVDGEFKSFPVAAASVDVTNIPTESAKGTSTLKLLGQKLEDVQIVDVAGDLYMALTPDNWTSMGPSSDLFAFATFLDPDKGVANLLRNAAGAKDDGRESIDGVETKRLTAEIPATPVNELFTNVANGTVPATIWVDDGNGALAKITLQPDAGRSITLAFSKWNVPVTVTKPI